MRQSGSIKHLLQPSQWNRRVIRNVIIDKNVVEKWSDDNAAMLATIVKQMPVPGSFPMSRATMTYADYKRKVRLSTVLSLNLYCSMSFSVYAHIQKLL